MKEKEQRKKYFQEYYQTHKKQKKKYYLNNREKLLKWQKEYNATHKEQIREYHLNNREKLLKQMRDYTKSPHGRLMRERYEQTPKRKRYRKAIRETRVAIDRGDIIKPKLCELCGKERRLGSHHEDYSKPLQVVWLCSDCHGKRHSAGNDDIKKKIRMIYEKKYMTNKKVMVIPERRSDEIMPRLSNNISIG